MALSQHQQALSQLQSFNALPAHLRGMATAHQQFTRYAEDSYSANTLRMVDFAEKHWAHWLAKQTDLPTECWHEQQLLLYPIWPDILCRYIDELSESMSLNSVQTYINLLNFKNKKLGFPSLLQHTHVQWAMRRATNRALDAGEQIGQAQPFRLHDLELLLQIFADTDDPKLMRDLLLVWIAYESLLRESELVNIRCNDLLPGRQYSIRVRKTKTTKTLEDNEVLLSEPCSQWLHRYMTHFGLPLSSSGYLFRRLKKNGELFHSEENCKKLSGRTVDDIFRFFYWQIDPDARAELQNSIHAADASRYQTWTGHSARVGAAIDLFVYGASVHEIMRLGRWRNDQTVMRYIRRVSMQELPMNRMVTERLKR